MMVGLLDEISEQPFSLLREDKGGKISDIQNNTNVSKWVLAIDIIVMSLRGIGISVTSMSLGDIVLFCISQIFPTMISY